MFVITGIVDDIKARFCSYEHQENSKDTDNLGTLYYVNKKTVSVLEVDGWEKDESGLKFAEYDVTLRDFAIRPAKKRDITFE